MIKKAKEFLGDQAEQVCIVQGSYANRQQICEQSGKSKFDFMLLDLGVNMDHFKVSERGFTIK